MTIDKIIALILQNHLVNGVKVVVIDYFQLIQPDPSKKFATEAAEYKDTMNQLRNLAKDYDIAIYLAAQRNRTGEGLDAILGSSAPSHAASVLILASLKKTHTIGKGIKVQQILVEVVKNRDGEIKDHTIGLIGHSFTHIDWPTADDFAMIEHNMASPFWGYGNTDAEKAEIENRENKDIAEAMQEEGETFSTDHILNPFPNDNTDDTNNSEEFIF
jgi:hypothetical protein